MLRLPLVVGHHPVRDPELRCGLSGSIRPSLPGVSIIMTVGSKCAHGRRMLARRGLASLEALRLNGRNI